MIKLSKKKALALSYQLWDLISQLPDESLDGQPNYEIEHNVKRTCIKAMGYDPNDVQYGCFCCEYALVKRDDIVDCRKCPVPSWRAAAGKDFDENTDDRPCINAEFGAFLNANTAGERRALAIAIRYLMEPE